SALSPLTYECSTASGVHNLTASGYSQNFICRDEALSVNGNSAEVNYSLWGENLQTVADYFIDLGNPNVSNFSGSPSLAKLSMTAQASDVLSGLKNYKYQCGTATESPNQNITNGQISFECNDYTKFKTDKTVKLKVFDQANNFTTLNWSIPTAEISTVLVVDNENWTKTPPIFTFRATGNYPLSVLNGYEYQCQEGGSWQSNFTNNNTFTCAVSATDQNGQKARVHYRLPGETLNFEHFTDSVNYKYDIQYPGIANLTYSPENAGIRVTGKVTDLLSGPNGYRYKCNTGTWTEYTSDANKNTINFLCADNARIDLKVRDIAGNEWSANTWNFPTISPSLTVTNENWTNVNTLTFTFNKNSHPGYFFEVKYKCKTSDVNWTPLTGTNILETFTCADEATSNTGLTAQVSYKLPGRTPDTKSVVYKIDQTKPIINSMTYVPEPEGIVVTAKLSDSASYLSNYQYECIGSTSVTKPGSLNGGSNQTFSFTCNNFDEYTSPSIIRLKVWDNAD
ncbi:MAG TPA: hypothetical protein PLQ36_03580, partial [Candidatus Gracilibacteria bacterium]|nr:hypothetical protein [Candidatus Gracilibacteria bacterium]